MTHQQQTAFENIVGKGEIGHNKQFLLFPQCFLLNQIIVSPFVHIFDIISLLYPPKTLFGGYIGVSLSVGPSVRWSVCSFLSALFLINYWTNFIQSSQVNSVSSRDVHMKCWLCFIDFSLSYGPFMKFIVCSFSHQLSHRFVSNYTNTLSIKQRCAYPILVMVCLGFMELWPFDDSGQIHFKKLSGHLFCIPVTLICFVTRSCWGGMITLSDSSSLLLNWKSLKLAYQVKG